MKKEIIQVNTIRQRLILVIPTIIIVLIFMFSIASAECTKNLSEENFKNFIINQFKNNGINKSDVDVSNIHFGAFTIVGACEAIVDFSCTQCFSHAEGWNHSYLFQLRANEWHFAGDIGEGNCYVKSIKDINKDGLHEVYLSCGDTFQGKTFGSQSWYSLKGFPSMKAKPLKKKKSKK